MSSFTPAVPWLAGGAIFSVFAIASGAVSVASAGMAAARFLAIVVLTALVGFGPGWFVVRKFRWSPLEALAASIGLSFTLLFIASFGAYWLGVPGWVDVAITAGAAALTVAGWSDLRRLWRHPTVRRSAWAFAGLTVWTLLLLVLIRQYGGGDWCCDWLEHYQRTGNFIEPLPLGFLYIGRYLLPVRPPLMNVVAADVLGQVGFTFWSYQILFSLLNLLLFVSACLVSRLFRRNGRPADPWTIAVLLGANPVFFMNTTYAWTKAFTAFFVLLGVALYVIGWRRRDRLRIGAAFLALAAATITHYSAAPCAILVGVHYLAVGRRRRGQNLAGAVAVIVPALLLVLFWAGYCVNTYGVRAGLLQNPSLEGTVPASAAEQMTTRLLNLRDTFVPHRFQGYGGYPSDATPLRVAADNPSRSIRVTRSFPWDWSMECSCSCWRAAALRRAPARERAFWLWFVLSLWAFGVLVHGDRDQAGLAQIALQPITYLGLAFLATRLRHLPGSVMRLWAVGAVLDLGLGIALEVWFEAGQAWARTPNWNLKADAGIHYLGDYWHAPMLAIVLLVVVALGASRFVLREFTARA